jgi:hypothetical protein
MTRILSPKLILLKHSIQHLITAFDPICTLKGWRLCTEESKTLDQLVLVPSRPWSFRDSEPTSHLHP